MPKVLPLPEAQRKRCAHGGGPPVINGMLTIKDLVPSPDQDGEDEADEAPHPAALVPGSTTAKALLAAWRGDSIVVVDSPPGGGKTRAASTMAAHLAVRAGANVIAAFPTRMQAKAFAFRIVRQVPARQVVVKMSGVKKDEIPEGTASEVPPKGGSVEIRTVASLARSATNARGADNILIVDEGYQVVLAELTAAAQGFRQIAVFGDPGQIGPVVAHDASLWDNSSHGPQSPAPHALCERGDSSVFHIGETWRLGQETVDVLRACYSFPFKSRRTARSVHWGDGSALGEIERLSLPQDERAAAKMIMERVVELSRCTLKVAGSEERPVTQADIAVVAARNVQVNEISSYLSGAGFGDVAVETADRMQGGEWPIVVALDPCYGGSGPSLHSVDIGRTCVMLSRHSAHLTWAHDDKWEAVVSPDSAGAKVRRTLMASPLV